MNRNNFILLIALLIVGCGHKPETLDEVKSEYVTVDQRPSASSTGLAAT